jgi:hypothetical protein
MMNQMFQCLEDTSLAVAIRKSIWMYPALEILHIAGIIILIGPAFMFDLRLLGFSKNISILSLANFLLTWSKRGLVLVIPSGLFLFITNATTLGYDPVFWVKMLLLVIAGINALVFHRLNFVQAVTLNESSATLARAKTSAIISIITWLAVIICGRLLAY